MKNEAPLAARMRPRTLEEYVGQEDDVRAEEPWVICLQNKRGREYSSRPR